MATAIGRHPAPVRTNVAAPARKPTRAPGRVPVCTGGLSPRTVQRELLAAAARAGVPAWACENRTSDHWPFEKAGEAVARIGGNSYAGYHSARDRVGVVRPAQIDRVGRLMWGWLTTGRGGSR